MADTPSSTISTRSSAATKTRYSGLVTSYANENLLASPIPYVRGKRFVTCWAMSSAYDIKSKSSSSGK